MMLIPRLLPLVQSRGGSPMEDQAGDERDHDRSDDGWEDVYAGDREVEYRHRANDRSEEQGAEPASEESGRDSANPTERKLAWDDVVGDPADEPGHNQEEHKP